VLVVGVLPVGREPNDPRRAQGDQTNTLLASLMVPGEVALASVGGMLLEPDGRLTEQVVDHQDQPTALGYESLTIAVSLLAQRLMAGWQ
jgi:hypothetical protein